MNIFEKLIKEGFSFKPSTSVTVSISHGLVLTIEPSNNLSNYSVCVRDDAGLAVVSANITLKGNELRQSLTPNHTPSYFFEFVSFDDVRDHMNAHAHAKLTVLDLLEYFSEIKGDLIRRKIVRFTELEKARSQAKEEADRKVEVRKDAFRKGKKKIGLVMAEVKINEMEAKIRDTNPTDDSTSITVTVLTNYGYPKERIFTCNRHRADIYWTQGDRKVDIERVNHYIANSWIEDEETNCEVG